MLPELALLFVTPVLYAVDASDCIRNGCEPPELLIKRYFRPLVKYMSGLAVLLANPFPFILHPFPLLELLINSYAT